MVKLLGLFPQLERLQILMGDGKAVSALSSMTHVPDHSSHSNGKGEMVTL
jgi:hypothetical protein